MYRHQRQRRLAKELHRLVERYGRQWRKEAETVENGFMGSGSPEHLAEAQVFLNFCFLLTQFLLFLPLVSQVPLVGYHLGRVFC